MKKEKFTILFLSPDEGSSETYQAHVKVIPFKNEKRTIDEAIDKGREELVRDLATDMDDAYNFAVVGVYRGHLENYR